MHIYYLVPNRPKFITVVSLKGSASQWKILNLFDDFFSLFLSLSLTHSPTNAVYNSKYNQWHVTSWGFPRLKATLLLKRVFPVLEDELSLTLDWICQLVKSNMQVATMSY